ncbi:MAG TPA: M15 family metallopeptidase [Candidatus Paceibacterota bacterium]
MPQFGAVSLRNLKGVDQRLVSICMEAIEIFDFQVVDGLRTEEEQRMNLAAGKSWTLHSKHLIGKAVDLAPWPIHWADTEMFCVLAGVMRAVAFRYGVKLRWGGDWNRNNSTTDEKSRDYGHFEIDE